MLSCVQKGSTKFLFVLLLLSSLLCATSIPTALLNQIQSQQLYQSKVWKKLMHYRQGESEIDDPRFFFSTQGKKDLKAELIATIEHLINDKSDDENSTQCIYPSRTAWIVEQLPQLNDHISHPKCTKLHHDIQTLNAKQITLILASAHINSPASAFGHTFLRVDANPDTPLLSYAINYAAQTNEDNGFIYAYQGLFGGYHGLYSVEPYTKKLKTYSDLEQRDVWEYPLELTQEEIDRLILHVMELQHFYADYFFLKENCSYNLLWLLEVAKPNLELTSKFTIKAIPIDTLRAIDQSNLIKETLYRPSKRKKILALTQELQDEPLAIEFATSQEQNLSTIALLSPTKRAKALELASQLLQVRHAKGELDQKKYQHSFLKLLRARSQLGKVPHQAISPPTPPREGHDSTRLSLSYGKEQEFEARVKIAYHDVYDNEAGYISGAYINFLDTAIDYNNQKLTLKELNLLDIRSYAIQEGIFHPISWQVATGTKRLFNQELNAYLQVGAGITLGQDQLFGYLMLTPTLYYRHDEQLSMATQMGMVYNPSSKLKVAILGKKEWFNKAISYQELTPFITYSIQKQVALNLTYRYQEQSNMPSREDLILSCFFYF